MKIPRSLRNGTYSALWPFVVGTILGLIFTQIMYPMPKVAPKPNVSVPSPSSAPFPVHWRLVVQAERGGKIIAQIPLTSKYYEDADSCIAVGVTAPEPTEHIDITCLPYRNEDTLGSVPIF